jgi:methylated-DNA-[protein]-cysteine S-methyltransferase
MNKSDEPNFKHDELHFRDDEPNFRHDEPNFRHDEADGTEAVALALRQAVRTASVEPPAIVDVAAAAGLLDVAYATLDSPVGKLILATTPVGLARLAYIDGDQEDEVLAEMAARLSPRMLSAPRRLDEPRRELDEYFAGRRRRFHLALDLRLLTDFARRILTATAEIPYGSVSTYRDVAVQAGSPRGSRAAGNALGSNPLPIVLPCHRVVHTGGGIGGYTGGLDRKRTLLAIEAGQPPPALA